MEYLVNQLVVQGRFDRFSILNAFPSFPPSCFIALFLGREDPLEKEMVTHFSNLAREIPWTEEPDGLQSMGLKRVGHN